MAKIIKGGVAICDASEIENIDITDNHSTGVLSLVAAVANEQEAAESSALSSVTGTLTKEQIITSDEFRALYRAVTRGACGTITCSAAQITGWYPDEWAAFHAAFPNVTVTSAVDWIKFADSEVLRILNANGVGSDGHVSISEAESVTSLNFFKGSSLTTSGATIESFDELPYFKNIQLGTYTCSFMNCANLKSIKLDGMTIHDVDYLFYKCSSLEEVDLSTCTYLGIGNNRYLFDGCKNLKKVTFPSSWVIPKGYSYGMFNNCSSLSSLDVSGFDTSNATNIRSMFNGCSSLTSIDVSGFDTSNVTDFALMFSGCSSLTTLDVSGFDTSNATNIRSMFNGCSSLTSIDVSGFDTSNVTDFSQMFFGCSSLTTLDVSGFDTGNATNMNNMFDYNIKKLLSLDIRNFNTIKVKANNSNLSDSGFGSVFFRGLSNLISLKISSSFFNCASRASSPHTNMGMFSYLTSWTDATEITNLLNCLPDLTGFTDGRAGTLKLSTNTYNVTTEAQRAAALAKGWTVTK